VMRDKYNLIPATMATLLHVIVFSALVFAFDFARPQPFTPLAMQATLVAEIPEAPRAKPEPAPEPEPEPVVVEPEPEPDNSEELRRQAEEEKRRQDALLEQKRLDELRKQQEAAEKKRREREDAERKKREETERLKREEAEKEKKRIEAEKKREEDIRRQREENERLRRELEAEQRAAELQADERRFAAANSPEMAAYQFALQQKVLRNWARPASAQPGLDCLVQVRQSATGEVISARVVSCNGDAAVERSIEAAVKKASPLPLSGMRLPRSPARMARLPRLIASSRDDSMRLTR